MFKFNFLNRRPANIFDTNSFRFWDNMVGWCVFAIATLSYWATMEPTTSLWDCSEFIATSYKLEVGHPPGAPLFMMLARIASLFAASPEDVALMINGMNSLVSGFTILFMFWTITHLARRIVSPGSVPSSLNSRILVLGAGVIGALSYAYTDTFWFSAVEGEVYALSSMFTALVVWLMFKWEENAESPTSMRWIILIAYLMGLSIGVHILNLLTIPALVMIFFFHRYKYNAEKPWWHYPLMIIGALVVSVLILGVINGIIIPYTVALGAHFDTLMVNSFGMPANAGMLIYVLLVFVALGVLIFTTHKRGKRILNVSLLCITVILIGFSSYAMMTVRANANPPMNSNNPSNPHMLLSVLNRDQYGARPLLKGVYYDAEPLPMVELKAGGEVIAKDANGYDYVDMYDATGNSIEKTTMWLDPVSGKYRERVSEMEYIYPEEAYHYFPRMWYPASDRRAGYLAYLENPETVNVTVDGKAMSWVEPSAGDNFRFFMGYQMGDMFWRYFMWNFVGRQDDVQLEKSSVNGGTYLHGGWLSGIGFIDEIFCGPQDGLPADMQNNPARNTYFFLPLLLGLLGLVYHLVRDWRNWLVVMLMFVMMGVALVVYFNTAPNEPRERDYVYAGAFYAFSIWIGLGVLGVGELFENIAQIASRGYDHLRNKATTIAVVCAVLFASIVPIILAVENWDDHDRSERTFARDMGWNYLTTAPENAIIINYGDNDTFPLWYCQEVEGVRPDVKVMNSSYLDAEWYIDQMRLASNDADGVPFTIPQEKYTFSDHYIWVASHPSEYITDKAFLKLQRSVSEMENNKYKFAYMLDGRQMEVELTLKAALGKISYCNDNELYECDFNKLTKDDKSALLICNAINANDEFWSDYELYYDLLNHISMLYPYSLPLADAIALYVSDEPMWMLADESFEHYRLVEIGSDIPEGFEVITTVQPKIDSQFSGGPDDYFMGAMYYTIPVDKEYVLSEGLVDEQFADKIVDEVVIRYDDPVISRSMLMQYDLLANNNWKRPICFTQPHLMEDLRILDYARYDGMCYTFVPVSTTYDYGYVNIDKLYPIFMDECEAGALNQALRFGNVANEDVLVDYFVRYNLNSSGVRGGFARVANGFIERGEEKLRLLANEANSSYTDEEIDARLESVVDDLAKAEALLDRGLKVLPPAKLGYEYRFVMPYVRGYYRIALALQDCDITEFSEDIFVKGDELNMRYVTNNAEWANYYLNYGNEVGFTAEIIDKISRRFEDILDGVASARSVGSHNLIAYTTFNFDHLADKYIRVLLRELPSQTRREVLKANEMMVANRGKSILDFISDKNIKVWVSKVYTLYSYLFDGRGNLYGGADVAYSDSLYELMKHSGLMEVSGIVVANQPSASAATELPATAELSAEVQDIVGIYAKGMEAWGRATTHLKKFVDSASSRLSVKVTVERVDDFQYFYAYSDYAAQLVDMASSKGVSLSDLMELLERSDEEYALADDYLKMGDGRAMEYIAHCYEDMGRALSRLEDGDYSSKDAEVVYSDMCEIIDVLNICLLEAGSFDWVANPEAGSSLGFEPVSFDALANRFLGMALSAVKSGGAEESVNRLFADVVVKLYSLVPSVRILGGKEVDAEYVDNMRSYLEYPAIATLINKMYK